MEYREYKGKNVDEAITNLDLFIRPSGISCLEVSSNPQ